MPLEGNKTRYYLPSAFVLWKNSLFKPANGNGRGTVRWLADDLPWVQVEIKSALVNEACHLFSSWVNRVCLFLAVFSFNCKPERMCKGLGDLECRTCTREAHSTCLWGTWGEGVVFTSSMEIHDGRWGYILYGEIPRFIMWVN